MKTAHLIIGCLDHRQLHAQWRLALVHHQIRSWLVDWQDETDLAAVEHAQFVGLYRRVRFLVTLTPDEYCPALSRVVDKVVGLLGRYVDAVPA